MSSVAVIDYGMGNLHSISKALQHADGHTEVLVTADRGMIAAADRVVFPGVGAIRDCMDSLRRLELIDVIREVSAQKPFLGICLGLQALLDFSEENGNTPCTGLFSGTVMRFREPLVDAHGQSLKVPHMGWNNVHQTSDHPLWKDIPQDSRFYFVHSYHVSDVAPGQIAATADYPDSFPVALADGKKFAVQFHPEKSQTAGLRLLANFLAWDGTV